MEIILGILLGVIFFVLGFIQGWRMRELYAVKKLDELLNKVEQEVDEEIKESIIPITIEKHQDTYFVYGVNDNQFIAQGNNRWELEKNLETRYPGKKFAASNENLKEVGFNND